MALTTGRARKSTTTTTTVHRPGDVARRRRNRLRQRASERSRPHRLHDYISFRTATTAEPVKYYYTKSTTFVDPTGRRWNVSAIRPDMPVTVYYVKEGDG